MVRANIRETIEKINKGELQPREHPIAEVESKEKIKLYKIKFIKDTELCKIGDIKECSEESAESAVNNGYAEYVEEPKTEKKEKKVYKKYNVIYDKKETSGNDLLKIVENPDLFNLITVNEFDKRVVGEIEARKTIFLVTCMRLVENLPKASDNLMINAFSGTGKDCVSEAVFGIIPESEKEELIKTTPKVLAYTRNRNIDESATWKKTALRLEDVDNIVLNDPAFKVMSSANPNKINKAKSFWRGKILDVLIEGKPSIIMTIAEANPKEELLRRFPILYMDESVNQTTEVLKRQATLMKEGKVIEYNPDIIEALAYLSRVRVKIPFADKLTRIFPSNNVIVRTHFPRFCGYIQASCALYQYQRKKDSDGFYIATEQDYEIARIALMKTTSNILMIPLTKRQKDILDIFEEHNLQNKSIDDLQEFKDIEKMNISNEWLRIQCDFLASKTFLQKNKERRVDEGGKVIPKPVFVYSYNQMQHLEIPAWKELNEINNNNNIDINKITLNNKNTSNTKITSNTGGVNEVIEVFLPKLHIDNSEKQASFYNQCARCDKIIEVGLRRLDGKNYCQTCYNQEQKEADYNAKRR